MAKHFERKGRRFLGINLQSWIKGFFSGNAGLSIVILFLICAFLVWEGVSFFPSHHDHLKMTRVTGQEYVDYIIEETDDYQVIVSLTNQAYFQELDARFGTERGIVEGFEVLLGKLEDDGDDFIEALEDARDDEDEEGIVKAESDWKSYVESIIEKTPREEIDSFDRLKDSEEAWQTIYNAARSYDPVEEDTPPAIEAADEKMKAGMAVFSEAKDMIGSAGTPLKDLRSKMVAIASETLKDAKANQSSSARKEALLEGAKNARTEEAKAEKIAEAEKIVILDEFPYEERIQPLLELIKVHPETVAKLKSDLSGGIEKLPGDFSSQPAADLVREIHNFHPRFVKLLERSGERADEWKWDKKVGFSESWAKFFIGEKWITNSSWHDAYGFLPLFFGSVIIAVIALFFAVPFSIGAAIYVNRLATRGEQTFIKPAIEMIQAIPSIVLGFFGIMVLGELLVDLSSHPLFSWLPFFPITERLNMFLAGLLLALMAVPTIFTLCEDALNNVPQAFSEASLALGASKLQTVNRVVVPAAISGILAAVLLGLGRVIGETMVVLLVAGNKISMPDWGKGLGVFYEPSHTMTGIIAQEMGEVSEGTLHYRALFLVGLVLFFISLCINVAAQKIIKRLGRNA